MDLGCLDLGCISVSDKKGSEPVLLSANKDCDSPESLTATSKVGKKALRESFQSTVNTLNKFTSQIKKPSQRRSSPLNWFPRKKVEPYLERKIKLLQEVDGKNLTLDETLGDSCPHYSRVKREQMAAREAACKAMEARKAALVEASWCRILQAARIHSKEAEALHLKAEKSAAEAFQAASTMGVIMYDTPNCSRKPCKVETSSPINGGGSTTHTVAASFETAFEVDKEVAAAVKTAFIRLASCPSFNRDEFKDMLRRINQNPDMSENYQELSDFSSECESDTGSEFEPDFQKDHLSCQDLDGKTMFVEAPQRKYKKRQLYTNLNMGKLVEMMLERLKCLQEDELESLATIVATCGLNAALAEVENSKQHEPDTADGYALGSALSFIDGQKRRKLAEAEVPSLDKFLVKHLTKLEREVLEAKNSRKNESKEDKFDAGKVISHDNVTPRETIPSLESILLVKHSSKLEKEIEEAKKNSNKMSEKEHKSLDTDVTLHEAVPDLDDLLIKHSSKLEREIEETKRTGGKAYEMNGKKSGRSQIGVLNLARQDAPELPSLDKFLVKHVSRLEREVQEAKNKRRNDPTEGGGREATMKKESNVFIPATQSEKSVNLSCFDAVQVGKENIDMNKEVDEQIDREQDSSGDADVCCSVQDGNTETKETENSLDKILVKPVHRLEREKFQSLSRGSNYGTINRRNKKQGGNNVSDCESLDKVLIKHVSRLEKERMRRSKEDDVVKVKRTNLSVLPEENEGGGLDQILVKHKSRLEREKMAAAHQPEDQPRLSVFRREARERELQEAWGGLSLGNSMRPHLSKLERDKAAWIKAEEEERRQALREE